MNPARLTVVRTAPLVILALASLVALIFSSYTIWQQRKHLDQEAKVATTRLTTLAAGYHGQVVERAQELLIFLSEIPETQTTGKPCNEFMARVRRLSKRYANLGVARPDGLIVCSALPMTQAVNISDRLYFQEALEKKTFSVGQYQIGRITGVPSINFGYPVTDQKGNLLVVIFVALDLAWLNDYVAETQLPVGSTIMIIDHNGTVLSRYPDTSWIGKPMFSGEVIGMLFAKDKGTAYIRGADGVPRLYAYHKLGQSQVVLSIGVPTASVTGAFDRSIYLSLILAAALSLVALGAHWLFIRSYHP